MREMDDIKWFPYTSGLKVLHNAIWLNSISSGAVGWGRMKELHVFAMEAGFQRKNITTGMTGTVYSDPEKREKWGSTWLERLDQDYGERLKQVKCIWGDDEAEREVGEEGLDLMRHALKEWKDDERGWCSAISVEVICKKT